MILEEERKHLSRQQEEYESNQIKVRFKNELFAKKSYESYFMIFQVRKMKNELEEIESQCMLFNSKARKLASDLQDVEEKVEHAEITLDTIWGNP